MVHIEEAIIAEDDGEEERLPVNDKFYTVTMAEILERQGLKKDAMKIYQILLKKGGQNNLVIKEKIERLMMVQGAEDRKKDFINWINKLQKGGS
ncbi:MAG: hypothetical protein HZB54_08315 [Deltaproteobacteria bacterium]|nr:hypothetical protein [Deltaproteobacteria bacterium]